MASEWAIAHGVGDLEDRIAQGRSTPEDYAWLAARASAPSGHILDAWNDYVRRTQGNESGGGGGFLSGVAKIVGGISGGMLFGATGASVGATGRVDPGALALDAGVATIATGGSVAAAISRASSAQRLPGANMDLKDFLRVAASGINTDEGGNIIYDYGRAASTLTQSLTPVMAMAPAMGGAGAVPSLSQLMARLGGGAITRAGAAVWGAVRSASGRIAGFVLASGKRISTKDAVLLAGQVGLTAAAATLGVSEAELAEAVMQELRRRRGRRGRGISAAALRTTTRTMRRVERVHKQIHRAAKSAVSHR